MTEAVCLVDAHARIGESPVWCARERVLYWIDIYGPALYRYDPATGENRAWPMPEPIGCIAVREGGGLIAGMRSGFAFIDLETGAVTPLHDPEADDPGTRLNDGRCDRRGRMWAGSMVEDRGRADGALWRYDPDGACHRMLGGLIISNGLAWSPDDSTMYHCCTRTRTVHAYDFDIEAGTVSNKRIFFTTDDTKGEGRPDGAAVDAEGCYWSARYDGWRLVRHDPDGIEMRIVEMPVAAVTMCAFGGDDLDLLYVTSASQRLTDADLKSQPQAGGLFALDVGVKGLPEPRFAG